MRTPHASPRRLGVAALVGVCVGLAVGRGYADGGERVVLRWSAPAGCPVGARVIAEVDRLLGARGARPPAPIQASAMVTPEERGGYRVHLETRGEGAPRVRELKGASCAALADATGLILALMIDPSAVDTTRDAGPPDDASAARDASAPIATSAPITAPGPIDVSAALDASAPSPLPSPAASSPLAAPPSSDASPAPPSASPSSPAPVVAAPPRALPPPTARAFRLGVVVAGALDLGTLPGVSVGADLAVALHLGPWEARVGAAIWPVHDATVEARASAGGTVDLFAATAGVCRSFLPGAIELGPCVGLELGRLHARGFGVTDPAEGSALWAAARAGGSVAWSPFAPLSLGVRLEAALPFVRPGFVLGNVGLVHRPAPVAGRAVAGAEIRF